MRIADCYGRGHPVVSFEFFPPKTQAGFATLYRTIAELKQLDPGFVSVTWGAGGSTRRQTIELVTRIQDELGITAMAHLTCVGSSAEEIATILDRLVAAGIDNVLALGGDPPRDDPDYRPAPGGFTYASELAAFVRTRWSLCIGGACYPETHPRATSPEADLEHLKQKVDAGAEFLLTQLYFDNADYFRFVDRARARGIGVPIVPGIMPIVSEANIRRITVLSGARIPPELDARLAAVGHDDAQVMELGIEWATRQCRELLDRGAPGLHFYTLNRSPATRRIHRSLFPA
ncbi:MAG: methylenetetrahydrofolate reductase [NAD(P)H] [Deltaproteobacteria bacterium]|nr:methylenetetrahydrofolate reductase [NAD(P)H] [Deltaproteobacteria bacterium]